MVKIQVSDHDAFKAAFLPVVHDDVVTELGLLKLSLGHLRDPASILVKDMVLAKATTKAIVDSIRTPKTENGFFNKNNYKNAVATYANGATRVHPVNWNNLINLVDHLLDENNGSLEGLLIGYPLDIKRNNDNLLNQFHITDEKEIDILKSGFNYEGDSGAKVRQFFYSQPFFKTCSYCNTMPARHTVNSVTGHTADQFYLDHFFSQTDHPLLALSLYNLVPSDSICNVDNKKAILFSDILHLNPYVSGFKRDMVFRPVLEPLSENIQEIELKINVARDSDRWKQLIGDEDEIDIAVEHGNLNVFQIYTKYNGPDLYGQMDKLMTSYKKVARNERSLRDILNEIEEENSDPYQNFKTWYEGCARTCFHEKEFGRYIFSKLHRDLLDFVYANYPQGFHDEVRQILEESYLPENGGE